MRWYPNSSCDLSIDKFDEEGFFVFNACSGQTHFLNELSFIVFKLLQEEGPLDLTELISKLDQIYEDLPVDADLQGYISSLISSLDTIGLIEPRIV